jgi:hypothetical protein
VGSVKEAVIEKTQFLLDPLFTIDPMRCGIDYLRSVFKFSLAAGIVG